MDICLFSLMCAPQNSKRVPFYGNLGLHVVHKPGICSFQLAIFRPYCLAHLSVQAAKKVVEESDTLAPRIFYSNRAEWAGGFTCRCRNTIFCYILCVNQLASFKSALLCSSHRAGNGTINRLHALVLMH